MIKANLKQLGDAKERVLNLKEVRQTKIALLPKIFQMNFFNSKAFLF